MGKVGGRDGTIIVSERNSKGQESSNVTTLPEESGTHSFADAKDLRAHIFNVTDLKEEIVDVPEWGCTILVKGMTAKQRADAMKGALFADGTPNLEMMYPKLCIASCYHPETGEQIFREADRDMLNTKAGGVLEKLALVAARLSGLDGTQLAEIRKN